MTVKTKGTICGIIAAISYGTNPLGALYLYKVGVNADSVLFYRYSIAALILAVIMSLRKISFRVKPIEIIILACLGVLFAVSSLSLFSSFHYMDAGIASTLLFVYPIMVAVIMAIFFKEKISFVTILSITMALAGIALLYKSENGTVLNTTGVLLVMMSSFTYALYIIIINRSSIRMSSLTLTFYVLLFGIATIVIHSFNDTFTYIQPLTTFYTWFFAFILALFPTVISLVTMAIAVRNIGSTPTAILGALEPLTAVAIGVLLFDESFTTQLACGIVLIIAGVLLIISGIAPRYQHIQLTIHRIMHRYKIDRRHD